MRPEPRAVRHVVGRLGSFGLAAQIEDEAQTQRISSFRSASLVSFHVGMPR